MVINTGLPTPKCQVALLDIKSTSRQHDMQSLTRSLTFFTLNYKTKSSSLSLNDYKSLTGYNCDGLNWRAALWLRLFSRKQISSSYHILRPNPSLVIERYGRDVWTETRCQIGLKSCLVDSMLGLPPNNRSKPQLSAERQSNHHSTQVSLNATCFHHFTP